MVREVRKVKTCRGCKEHHFDCGYGYCKKTRALCTPDTCDQSKMIEVVINMPDFLAKAGIKEKEMKHSD